MAAGLGILNWFKSGENLSGIGSLLSAAGGIYGGYQQAKYAKGLLNLQKSDYARGIKREDEADKSLSDAFNNSTYNKKPLVKLG